MIIPAFCQGLLLHGSIDLSHLVKNDTVGQIFLDRNKNLSFFMRYSGYYKCFSLYMMGIGGMMTYALKNRQNDCFIENIPRQNSVPLRKDHHNQPALHNDHLLTESAPDEHFFCLRLKTTPLPCVQGLCRFLLPILAASYQKKITNFSNFPGKNMKNSVFKNRRR